MQKLPVKDWLGLVRMAYAASAMMAGLRLVLRPCSAPMSISMAAVWMAVTKMGETFIFLCVSRLHNLIYAITEACNGYIYAEGSCKIRRSAILSDRTDMCLITCRVSSILTKIE